MTRLTAANTDALDRITHIMPQLTLDNDQRHTLMRHLDRVRVTKLMRREPSPHASARRGTSQLLASRRRLPPAANGCAADHTEQRADGQLTPEGDPRLQL